MYAAPLPNPVTVTVVAVAGSVSVSVQSGDQFVPPSVLRRTWYFVIGPVGAVHDSSALRCPPVAVNAVGCAGTATAGAVVVPVAEADQALVPSAFVACTCTW